MSALKEKILETLRQWTLLIMGVGLIALGIYTISAEVWVGKVVFTGIYKNILGLLECLGGVAFIVFNFTVIRNFRK